MLQLRIKIASPDFIWLKEKAQNTMVLFEASLMNNAFWTLVCS